VKVIDDLDDPIYVTRSVGIGLRLRIGEPQRGQGKTRYAILSTTEARAVAYALLYEATQTDIELRHD
jgi:hypothetical protein